MRFSQNPFGSSNLSSQNKDIDKIRTYLENSMEFDVCETLTEQTFGHDIEGALLEVRMEAEARTRKGTEYVVNVI